MSEPAPNPTPAPPPEEQGLGSLIATTLRAPEALRDALDHSAATKLSAAVIVPTMATVGLLVASFAGGSQYWAVPLKVVAGTLVAMAICLPSLFVFANLTGSRIEVRQALGSMLVAVSVLALVLLALAPVGWIFSVSTDSRALVGGIHVLFLCCAAWFGASALRRLWFDEGSGATNDAGAASMARGGRRRTAGLWMLLFLVVLFQLSTTLRPIVGDYEPLDLSAKMTFVEHWFGSEDSSS